MLLSKIASAWQDSMEDPEFRFEMKAQEISVNLSLVLANSGLTQQELAKALAWRESRVSKVLHGGTNLTLKTLYKVCEALNTNFDIQFCGQSKIKDRSC